MLVWSQAHPSGIFCYSGRGFPRQEASQDLKKQEKQGKKEKTYITEYFLKRRTIAASLAEGS